MKVLVKPKGKLRNSLQGHYVVPQSDSPNSSLPGQPGAFSHSFISKRGPRQSLPPNKGGGLVQLRYLVRVPNPHDVVHADQSVHGVKLPFTVTKQNKNLKHFALIHANYIAFMP